MLITPAEAPLISTDRGYLLLEPSNLPTELQGMVPQMHPCVPQFLWAAEASMPLLLKLDDLTLEEKELVFQILEQELTEQFSPVVCAWLQSSIGIEELADNVARLVTGYAKDGGQVIWRYYDPRVFILTAKLFTDAQGYALLGEVDRWTFPWRRRWWHVQQSRPFVPSPDDLDVGWPDTSQWDLLTKSRSFYQVHARLYQENLSPAQCIDDLGYSIMAFQESSHFLHMESDEQRAKYVLLSTRYREVFRTQHELIEKWGRLRRREITLQQMLESIDPEILDLMEDRIKKVGRFV
ncbi:DUF4123 domain-containing protein [Pseudoduganella albidiflava]|uniref:DUF4123 domain-containing protein n=1 Tax=Pseudoduganella albidiflava TaxID=321983 RepID=A0A411X6X7_9BURK|nr:DUF4123 domain-containing protein [Pseudoduganella albidiflava]QBI04672.1 DUF4123 domain-containing protein [Pseudoduganella albidiflava]GGY29130.1 hypothetical protein GCM10007387_09210 [Pseudoduganella albidiflava]